MMTKIRSKKARHVIINGEPHEVVVLRIEARDAQGRPSRCTVGHDDTVFDLTEGNEFMTAFVASKMLRKAS